MNFVYQRLLSNNRLMGLSTMKDYLCFILLKIVILFTAHFLRILFFRSKIYVLQFYYVFEITIRIWILFVVHLRNCNFSISMIFQIIITFQFHLQPHIFKLILSQNLFTATFRNISQ